MTHHLMGVAEIAKMLGVSRQRADQLAGRPDFPKPVASLAAGRVWATEEVDEWIKKHRS